ncbi:MAG: hypothetical protein QOH11_1495, partial [Solirubrobacteraceae bacterium]|nr:hypothetical protein [Solirubrobacteraceae bacterium]
ARLGGWAQASVRWIVERRLVLGTGLVAAIPVIASTVRAVSARWVPLGDDGVIAVRAFDVFSTHSPLLGQYSNSSGVTGQELHSLGPLLYWLLALPVHLFGYASPAVTMGLVNTACVIGVVLLARRRGGPALMIATAVAVALMCGSFAAEVLHDVWNPAAALMPFTLLIFLAWSLACGEHRLLPVTVLVASFVAQCHMTYVLPALGMLAVATVGLIVSRRSAGPGRREPLRRWAIAAVAVAAVCWSAPLLDQAIHRPGNLVVLARTATSHQTTLGAAAGGRAVVRAVGIPPWWLRPAPEPIPRLGELAGGKGSRPPGAFAIATTVLILAAVLGLGLAAVRRRRHDVAAALAVSLVLCATLALAVASTPLKDNLFLSVGYTSWWGAPAGMFVWLALGWSALALFPLRRATGLRVPAWATAAGVGAAAVVAALVAANAGPDPLSSDFRPVRAIIARIDAQVPRDRPVFVDSASTYAGIGFQPAVVLALRRRGIPVTSAALLPALGQHYNPTRHPDAAILRIDEGDRPAPPGGRVIARVSVHAPSGKAFGQLAPAGGRVTVTLAPRRPAG